MIREKHIVESDKLSVSVSIYINRTNWPFELVGEQLGHKFFNLKSKDSLYRTRKPADRYEKTTKYIHGQWVSTSFRSIKDHLQF